jgi:hypothetical protein
MTVSEQLFEQLCMERNVPCELIPTAAGQRTADYRIWLDQQETIVEVKQIEPSDHERELLASALNDDAPAVVSNAHIRIRNKFDIAKHQLRNLSGGRLPSLFVLYDNTNGLSGLDDEDFLNAMHGDEVLEISSTASESPSTVLKTFHTFGKKSRKVGKHHNRSVSAVCRLLTDSARSPRLRLYHNEFASNPLTMEAARLIAYKQFVRPPSEQNEYRPWTELRVT